MSYSVGPRCGSDLALLWLWHRTEATAPMQPLTWELPYATGVPLERQKDQKKKGKKERKEERASPSAIFMGTVLSCLQSFLHITFSEPKRRALKLMIETDEETKDH